MVDDIHIVQWLANYIEFRKSQGYKINRLKISKLQLLPNYISLNNHKKRIVCTLDPLVIYTNVQKPVLFPLSFMFCATLVKIK